MEDRNQKNTDLDLVNSLRSPKNFDSNNFNMTATTFKSKVNSQTSGNKSFSMTIPNPPSFYDDDIQKY